MIELKLGEKIKISIEPERCKDCIHLLIDRDRLNYCRLNLILDRTCDKVEYQDA